MPSEKARIVAGNQEAIRRLTLFRGPSRHRKRAVLNNCLSAADGSAHSSRPTTGRGEVTLIRSDFDHRWEWRAAQNKKANAVLLKHLYNFSCACVGLLPPIFGADMLQSCRLAACPRRFSTAHYPPAARESSLSRDRLGRERQIAASGWKTYVGFYNQAAAHRAEDLTVDVCISHRRSRHVHCSHTQEISDR